MNKNAAEAAVSNVFWVLHRRKGFDWWWDDLDEDVQAEILEQCIDAVLGLR